MIPNIYDHMALYRLVLPPLIFRLAVIDKVQLWMVFIHLGLLYMPV